MFPLATKLYNLSLFLVPMATRRPMARPSSPLHAACIWWQGSVKAFLHRPSCSTLLLPLFLSSHHLILFHLCFDYILPHCRNLLLYISKSSSHTIHYSSFQWFMPTTHLCCISFSLTSSLESNYRTMQLLIKRLCIQEADATKQVGTSVITRPVYAPTTFWVKLRQNPPKSGRTNGSLKWSRLGFDW